MKKILSICLISFSLLGHLKAQQDPMYGQYVFNTAIINPAQAGVQQENQLGLLHRQQWLGIEGAPVTNSMFVNLKLPKNLGLALGVYHDAIGPLSDVSFQGDLATHIRLTEKWNLSGGVRTMMTNVRANLTAIPLWQSYDPNFSQNYNTGFFVNMGAGILLYTDKVFIGASVPKLIAREIGDGRVTITEYQRHFFSYAGMNLGINEDWRVTPSVLFKSAIDAPIQFDLNLMFDYKEVFDIGPIIRAKDAIGFIAGYRISPLFYVGYTYEYPMNDINLVTQQSHEISLRMLWKSANKNRINSPRYFY